MRGWLRNDEITAQSGEAKKLQPNKSLYSQSRIHTTLQEQSPQSFLVSKNSLSIFHNRFYPHSQYFLQSCLLTLNKKKSCKLL